MNVSVIYTIRDATRNFDCMGDSPEERYHWVNVFPRMMPNPPSLTKYEALCVVWCHLYIFKNIKSTQGGMLLLAKLQAEVFFHFLNCKNGTKCRKVSHIFGQEMFSSPPFHWWHSWLDKKERADSSFMID